MADERLLILDTPSLYFRAFYGVPDSVTAPDGTPVNAIRGLIDFIARLVIDYQPTRLVAAMDADWRPAWRVAAVPSYKLHRVAEDGGDQVPPALAVQVPVIEEVLDAVGLCRLGVAGYEADDVIATLATRADCGVDIVTGDRDLFQLVRDDLPVRVVYIAKGVGNAQLIDEAEVIRRYGVPSQRYADFATLRGDPSDGLPGVTGVGDKGAAALVDRFGRVEAIVDAATSGSDDGFPRGTRTKVLAAADYLARATGVVRVACDVDLGDYDDRLRSAPRDRSRLADLETRWGLRSAMGRLLAALGQDSAE